MIRRVLLGLSLIGAACAGLDCNEIFGLDKTTLDRPNFFFAGCFSGPVTEPPGGPGLVTVVFEAPESTTHNLVGCMRSTDPLFDASHAGTVKADDRNEALITVMPLGRPAFAVLVTKQAADPGGEAASVSLINQTGFGFKRAEMLPRCTLTCADLGISQSFGPGEVQ